MKREYNELEYQKFGCSVEKINGFFTPEDIFEILSDENLSISSVEEYKQNIIDNYDEDEESTLEEQLKDFTSFKKNYAILEVGDSFTLVLNDEQFLYQLYLVNREDFFHNLLKNEVVLRYFFNLHYLKLDNYEKLEYQKAKYISKLAKPVVIGYFENTYLLYDTKE